MSSDSAELTSSLDEVSAKSTWSALSTVSVSWQASIQGILFRCGKSQEWERRISMKHSALASAMLTINNVNGFVFYLAGPPKK